MTFKLCIIIILYFQLLNIKISKEELEAKFNQANTEKGNVGKEVKEKINFMI